MAKADGIVCGTEVAARVFTMLDPSTDIEILKADGETVKYGDDIMRLHGKTAVLLKGERTITPNAIESINAVAIK